MSDDEEGAEAPVPNCCQGRTKGEVTTEVAGWLGSAAIIIGYAYSWDTLTYFVLNASGGVALMGYSFKRKVYQPLLLNAVWTGISIYRFISDTI